MLFLQHELLFQGILKDMTWISLLTSINIGSSKVWTFKLADQQVCCKGYRQTNIHCQKCVGGAVPINQYMHVFSAVKLFEGTVTQRKTIIDPFVWITSRITQPPSKYLCSWVKRVLFSIALFIQNRITTCVFYHELLCLYTYIYVG